MPFGAVDLGAQGLLLLGGLPRDSLKYREDPLQAPKV